MALRIITSPLEMQKFSFDACRAGKRVGVVPTMGYLHEGHLSLIAIAKKRCDEVVLTLFVNPLQFGKGEDFQRYPRDPEADTQKAEAAGATVLFAPSQEEMYPKGFSTAVEVQGASSILEGAFRPGHFSGVATVVAKLFLITQPHLAVFGQKDAQQAFIIRRMARDLNIGAEIVIAPIVREKDGLAMSSRNVYLSPDERNRATALYRSLLKGKEMTEKGEQSLSAVKEAMLSILVAAKPTQIDYIAAVDPETFTELDTIRGKNMLIVLAVRFGTTRLLDNIIAERP